MPGPGKKPSHLKAISGTAQPCRAPVAGVELPPLEHVPLAPDWLPNAHAVREWDRLAPLLQANKLLTQADLGPLGQFCALHGKLVQLWAAGESPTGHMLQQYRAIGNDFGLSPVARGKVRASGESETTNRFAKFRRPEPSAV